MLGADKRGAGPNTRDHELEEVLYNFVSLMVIDVTIKKVVTLEQEGRDPLSKRVVCVTPFARGSSA